MMMNRKVPLEGKALTAYVARKRSTEGSYDSWSDWFTFEACAAMLDRPVLQVTYPRYVNGKKRPELPPAFYRSYCGSNDKLPV
jgi:N-formylglutamate amidohydrolase